MWELRRETGGFSDGRFFRILTLVDCHQREMLSLTPRANFSAYQVTEVLDALVSPAGGGGGLPKNLRLDHGTEPKDCGSEFAGRMLDLWADLNGVAIEWVALRPPPALPAGEADRPRQQWSGSTAASGRSA